MSVVTVISAFKSFDEPSGSIHLKSVAAQDKHSLIILGYVRIPDRETFVSHWPGLIAQLILSHFGLRRLGYQSI
jgi:hypothetical protein